MKFKKHFISSILVTGLFVASCPTANAAINNQQEQKSLVANNKIVAQANKIQNGWFQENGNWYFYKDSVKQIGWLELNGVWYYLKSNGVMATGWEKINNVYYYFNPSGSMKTGWLDSNGTWYYLKPSGIMATGWEKINNVYYYFNSSGSMKTGWLDSNGTWYYLKSSGAMATGWLDISGKWYYFYGSGSMATNTTIGDWTIGSNGVGVPPSSNIEDSSNLSTVYITPGGKSYHKSRNCTALKRSNTVLSVSLNEALSEGKSDPCNLCIR